MLGLKISILSFFLFSVYILFLCSTSPFLTTFRITFLFFYNFFSIYLCIAFLVTVLGIKLYVNNLSQFAGIIILPVNYRNLTSLYISLSSPIYNCFKYVLYKHFMLLL